MTPTPSMRQVLEWTAAALQSLSNGTLSENSTFTISGVKRSIREILDEADAALGAPSEQPQKRCQYCDDTGDVHGIDGEWRGVCTECNAAPQQPAQGQDAAPTYDVGHAHFTPFYLLANCRRICEASLRRKANWVLAMELFALGSTSARKVCRDAGIDPDGLEVRPVAMTAAQGDGKGGKQ